MLVGKGLAAQPGGCGGLQDITSHQQEFRLSGAGDGQVRDDPALVVQPLGIDIGPHRHRHVVGADPVQHAHRIAALHDELAHEAFVEKARCGARGVVFAGRQRVPGLAVMGVGNLWRRGVGREPPGHFPTRQVMKIGPHRGITVVQRQPPHPPCRLVVPMRQGTEGKGIAQ